MLGVAFTNNMLYVDRVDEAFEEALGDLPVVEGAIFGLSTFGLVTWGACPLGSCKLRGR